MTKQTPKELAVTVNHKILLLVNEYGKELAKENESFNGSHFISGISMATESRLVFKAKCINEL